MRKYPPIECAPAGLIAKVVDKATGARVYLYDWKGAPGAKVYLGKQGKPALFAYYRGRNPVADRDAAVKRLLDGYARQLAEKAEREAARKAFVHPYKPGDIFKSVWGYEQTNVDYYECVRVAGKHLIVREIATEYEAATDMTGHTVPVPGGYAGAEKRYLAQEGGFRIASYAFARFLEPKVIAGCRVYERQYVSSYA